MTQTIQLFFYLLLFVACSSKQPAQNEATNITDTATVKPPKDNFAKGEIQEHVACLQDASQSYALYIPLVQNEAAMPVIFFFDPHGDGALPLRHYKALADGFHFILLGSNNSKNGNDWAITQTIVNTLFSDVQNRFPINPNRIYTCGFSGGAKVAGYAALHSTNINIKSVIAAGAGLPDGEPVRDFSFQFTGMAGNGDMNMTDLLSLNNELNKTGTRHRLILFSGKHAWPPEDAMRIAFTGLQLDAIQDKQAAVNDSLINAYASESKRKIEAYIPARQLPEAAQACELPINLLNGFPAAADWFVKKEKEITNNPIYAQQSAAAQQLLMIEQSTKQTYQQQFQQADMQYWTATINNLQTKATKPTNEGAMYQRLLAYLSLAFYSISNNLITNNQNQPARYFVTLYKMADATNSEAWYLSAILDARNGDEKATENDLAKAADYGFTDTARLRQQAEFKTVSPPVNLAAIESKMKKRE